MLVATASMEGVAWFTHKYVMHGFLWFLHKDHHHKGKKNWFEENDFFFVIFALPSMILLYVSRADMLHDYRFWMGCGIGLYGLLYFVLHDIFIHQRFKVFSNSENRYLKAIRRAHKVHHKHMFKEQGECFGMLMVPKRYFNQYKKEKA